MKREFILKSDYDRKAFASRLSAIAETKPLRVVVSLYRKNRTLAQNRLNFLWCNTARKWMWEAGIGYTEPSEDEPSRPFTSDELHDWHKELFLPTEAITIDGRTVMRRSSHDKNTAVFSEFLGEIDAYWAQRGLQLPHPDDLYNEAMGRVQG